MLPGISSIISKITLRQAQGRPGQHPGGCECSGTVVEAHDYAAGIPSGLPVWAADAGERLPEWQRDEGEVYREGAGYGDQMGLLWGAVLLGCWRPVVECGCVI